MCLELILSQFNIIVPHGQLPDRVVIKVKKRIFSCLRWPKRTTQRWEFGISPHGYKRLGASGLYKYVFDEPVKVDLPPHFDLIVVKVKFGRRTVHKFKVTYGPEGVKGVMKVPRAGVEVNESKSEVQESMDDGRGSPVEGVEESSVDDGQESPVDDDQESSVDSGQDSLVDDDQESSVNDGQESPMDDQESSVNDGQESPVDDDQESSVDDGQDSPVDDDQESSVYDGQDSPVDDQESSVVDGQGSTVDGDQEPVSETFTVSPRTEFSTEWIYDVILRGAIFLTLTYLYFVYLRPMGGDLYGFNIFH